MTTLYGIKNCDTIKKARAWLQTHNITYSFVDYRQDGLTAEQLKQFAQECGWQQLLNTRGTTFRQLPEADRTDLTEEKALALMLAQPAMIKRPLLVHQQHYVLGFKADEYQRLLESAQ